MLFLVFACFYSLFHCSSCREIPYKRNDQKYCLSEKAENYLRFGGPGHLLKPLLRKLVCAAKVEGEYIKKISECFAQFDTLTDLKNSAKQFLDHHAGDDSQIPFNRCLGTMKIKPGDDNHNKKAFYDCMANNDFENKIETSLKEQLTDNELNDFEEFMECIAKATDDDFDETTQDCIDTNAIFKRIVEIIGLYLPVGSAGEGILRSDVSLNDDDDSNSDEDVMRIIYLFT